MARRANRGSGRKKSTKLLVKDASAEIEAVDDPFGL
jgi:hypothetical protein